MEGTHLETPIDHFSSKRSSPRRFIIVYNRRKPEDGMPKWKWPENYDEVIPMANIAKAVVSIIRQVPMQPLYEGDLVEDQLISFTLHNYKKDKDLYMAPAFSNGEKRSSWDGCHTGVCKGQTAERDIRVYGC